MFEILSILALIFFIIVYLAYWLFVLIKKLPILIIIPISLFIIFFPPTRKAKDEYINFFEIHQNISQKFQPLIDPKDSEPIIKYRMKYNLMTTNRNIFCRSVVYKLNPNHKSYLIKNTKKIYKVSSFDTNYYIASCVDELMQYRSKPEFLAPFLTRISKGTGSYLVYGSTENIETANKFHSSNTIEKYVVDSEFVNGNTNNKYFILIDEH